jgi:hypothetical protein
MLEFPGDEGAAGAAASGAGQAENVLGQIQQIVCPALLGEGIEF